MSEFISKAMRQRLMTNREGKLTSDQWRELVTEPVTPLLILMIPGVFVFGPTLGRIGARGLLFILAVIVIVFGVPLLWRAWGYSRATVEYAILYTNQNSMTRWLFWRPTVFYTAKGQPVRFRHRAAPITILKPNTAYHVYYLAAPSSVLLSLAPDDHPDAASWQPISTYS